MEETAQPVLLASLSERQRTQAMARFALLQPHLERNVPLAHAARDGGIAPRTARRWLQSFRAGGLVGLVRAARNVAGQRKLSADLTALVTGADFRAVD